MRYEIIAVTLLVVSVATHSAQALPVSAFAPASLLGGVTYYVDKNSVGGRCSDSNPGTIGQPFCSIQQAASYSGLQPGDKITVRRGDYAEAVRVRRSGTSSAPISFVAYPGEVVRVGSFYLYDISHVVIDGFEFVQSLMTHGERSAITLAGSSNYNLIRNLNIHDLYDTYGIDVYGGVSIGNILEYNRIWNLDSPPNRDTHCIMLSQDRDTIVRYNQIWNCQGDAIQLYPADSLYDKGNMQILYNHLYVEPDWAMGCENALDIKQGSQSGTVLIKGNIMHGFRPNDAAVGGSGGGGGAAVVIHYEYADNIVLDSNYIYDVYKGIWVAKADYTYTRIHVINNVFKDIKKHPWPIDNWAYVLGFGAAALQNFKVMHNTILDASMWIMNDASTPDSILRNNLFVNAGTQYKASSIAYADHNGWFGMSSSNRLSGTGDVVGSSIGLQTVSWNLLGDAYTVSAGLPANSKLINAGVNAGIMSDFLDRPRSDGKPDVGALEYAAGSSAATPTPTPTRTPASPGGDYEFSLFLPLLNRLSAIRQ